jgi:hypothetical protein
MKGSGVYIIFVASLLTSCVGFDIRKNPNVKPPEVAFPKNAVVAFNSVTCPSGWSAFNELKGRSILGAGSGNVDHYGNPLTSRALHDTGGLTFTSSIPASSQNADHKLPVFESDILGTSAASLYQDPASSTGAMSGTEGNMAPYYVQKFCKNNADLSEIPQSSVIASKSVSCPSQWSASNTLRGRMIVGEGSGNLDIAGNLLPARTLAQSGGYEETVLDMVVDSNAATEQSPDGMTLGPTADAIYTSQPPDSSFAGSLTDSNMPPYAVVRFCETPAAAAKIESGTILAFDQNTCPNGWSPYLAGQGRILFGAGTGNMSGAGKPLTFRPMGQTGGLEYTSGIPLFADLGDSNSPDGSSCFAAAPSIDYLASAVPDVFLSGNFPSPNLPPFYTLLYCEKN